MGRPKKKQNKRSDGLYEVKVTVDHDFEGKAIRKSFYSSKSEADARKKAEDYKINLAIKKQTGKMSAKDTFDEVIEKMYEEKKDIVRPQTIYDHKIVLHKHFSPELGNKKISAIRSTDLKKIFQGFASKYAHSTINHMYGLVAAVFNYAVENELINRSPMFKRAVIDELGAEPVKKRVYSADQIKYVLDYCYNNPSQTSFALHLMITYGFSRSETLGLTRDAIDLEKKTISIFQALTVQNGRSAAMKTKNKHRKRTLPLFDSTCAFFAKVDFEPDCDFIFSKDKKMMSIPTFNYRYNQFMQEMSDHFKQQGIDVPPLHCHELRHTRATAWVKLVREGKGAFAYIKAMGWSSSKMIDIYADAEIDYLKEMITEDDK